MTTCVIRLLVLMYLRWYQHQTYGLCVSCDSDLSGENLTVPKNVITTNTIKFQMTFLELFLFFNIFTLIYTRKVLLAQRVSLLLCPCSLFKMAPHLSFRTPISPHGKFVHENWTFLSGNKPSNLNTFTDHKSQTVR